MNHSISKALEQQLQYMQDVGKITADRAIRELCKAREKYIREMNTVLKERDIAFLELEQELEKKRQELEKKKQEAEQQRQEWEKEKQKIEKEKQKIEKERQQLEQLLQENKRERAAVTETRMIEQTGNL